MKVIARPVGTNKTKQLIIDAIYASAQILTTNKRALRQKAIAYGIEEDLIPPMIELGDLIYGEYDHDKPLFIHKIEEVMADYFKSDFDLELQECSIATKLPPGMYVNEEGEIKKDELPYFI